MGSSKNTLNHLDLSGNGLTRIPRQIIHFPQLKEIYLDYQKKPGFYIVPVLSLLAPILHLGLSNCSINELQTETFQGLNCMLITAQRAVKMRIPIAYNEIRFYLGSFQNTSIDLSHNNLTRFESSVFRKVLKQVSFMCLNGSKYK